MKRYDPTFQKEPREWLGMLTYSHGEYVQVKDLREWLTAQHRKHTMIVPYYAGNVFVEWREKPTAFSQLLDTLGPDHETPTSSDP